MTLDNSSVTNADLLVRADQWCRDGHGVAIAMVMQTWGSSPRPVGSIMVVRDDMAVEGSVSGGCVEGAVIDAALDSLASGGGKRLDFGVADARAWEVGLSCGGRIAVLVTPVAATGLPPEVLSALAGDIGSRRSSTLGFDAETGAVQDAAKADDGEHSFLSDDEASFILRQVPPRRVFVVGGVHITQFLAPMARQAGYDVTIIDPREVFSTAERFPGSACLTAWPDEAMEGLRPDARTAVVTLTHDPKIDDRSRRCGAMPSTSAALVRGAPMRQDANGLPRPGSRQTILPASTGRRDWISGRRPRPRSQSRSSPR